ncbi:MAG TPA: HEAT repeat domain-containing protein [Gemmatimonadales bacterium]|nr:HEAT repeat domain-containing protein [Gemmatimonadales bacterium]
MLRMQLWLALAAAVGSSGWWAPAREAAPAPAAQAQAGPAELPPPPTHQGDPADSLYRAARDALSRREYRRAADLFARIPDRYPASGYAPDALYWQAFALYRVGTAAQLREARDVLHRQRERYPDAATRGDAATLDLRIQGELARRGDRQAAEEVRRVATGLAEPPVPPHAPDAPEVPEVPEHPEVPEPPEAPEPAGHAGDHADLLCRDDSTDMKVAAINALLHMGSEKAKPILRRVLARRDAASVCLRRKAVFLISQGGAEGAEDILIASARTDPDLEVREQAVFWLSQVGSERAVGALDSILRTSTDRRLQDKAIFALSQQNSPRARQALRTFAERSDAPESLREQVIFWIGQSGGPESGTYLRQLFGRVQGEELRKKILFSLSQMGGQENGKWLIGVARDRNQPLELRKQALFWAGQGDAPAADLVNLYGSFDDREMKEQLIFVYSQREEPAMVDKLLDISLRDSDTELRKKALFWLGQSDDPRAAKALQSIIEQP